MFFCVSLRLIRLLYGFMNTWMPFRYLPAIVAACLLSLTDGANTAELKIVTSFYPIYLATLSVAGNIPGVEFINMTQPLTGCLHDYQLTPDNLVSLSKADIFVVNGAGMETFLDKAIQQVPRLKLIQARDGIALISTTGIVNPHVWVSVTAHMQQVEKTSPPAPSLFCRLLCFLSCRWHSAGDEKTVERSYQPAQFSTEKR